MAIIRTGEVRVLSVIVIMLVLASVGTLTWEFLELRNWRKRYDEAREECRTDCAPLESKTESVTLNNEGPWDCFCDERFISPNK